MPSTPNLAFPYPALGDTADVPRDIAALANKLDTTQFPAASLADDSVTLAKLDPAVESMFVPIGTIVPFAGTALPPGGRWDWADGGLIDRTTYADFFAAVQHAYNGNLDPGSNKVRKPDKRGRSSIGAINFGPTGAGPATNARAQVARGVGAGEVNHQLAAGESGVNGSGSTAIANDTGSSYAQQSMDHNHYVATPGYYFSVITGPPSDIGLRQKPNVASGWDEYGPSYAAGWVEGINSTTGSIAQNIGAHTHVTSMPGHALIARTADVAHNTLHPYEADNYIVRIA
jgi:hypothetical protein